MTHVHYIVKDDKCCTLCLGFISQTYLTNTAVPSEKLVEVVASDLIIEILYKQDPICTWRELRLRWSGLDRGFGRSTRAYRRPREGHLEENTGAPRHGRVA